MPPKDAPFNGAPFMFRSAASFRHSPDISHGSLLPRPAAVVKGTNCKLNRGRGERTSASDATIINRVNVNQERESRAEAAKSIWLFFYPICKAIKGRKRVAIKRPCYPGPGHGRGAERASLVISFFFDRFCPTISLPILLGGKDFKIQQRNAIHMTFYLMNPKLQFPQRDNVKVATK